MRRGRSTRIKECGCRKDGGMSGATGVGRRSSLGESGSGRRVCMRSLKFQTPLMFSTFPLPDKSHPSITPIRTRIITIIYQYVYTTRAVGSKRKCVVTVPARPRAMHTAAGTVSSPAQSRTVPVSHGGNSQADGLSPKRKKNRGGIWRIYSASASSPVRPSGIRTGPA